MLEIGKCIIIRAVVTPSRRCVSGKTVPNTYLPVSCVGSERTYKNSYLQINLGNYHLPTWKHVWHSTEYVTCTICATHSNLRPNHKISLTPGWQCIQGLYSLSGKTSYRQISWSLEAARLGVIMIVSLWNLTGISAALLPRCLLNFRAIGKVQTRISRLRDFTRSCGKTSYRLVNRGPGSDHKQNRKAAYGSRNPFWFIGYIPVTLI